MKEYKIIFHDCLPFIEENGNIILIDTGSFQTIHRAENLIFNSKNYKSTINHYGTTIDYISKMVRKNFTTLLGMDVLSNYYVLFDYRKNIVKFSEEEIDIDGKEIKFIESFSPHSEIIPPIIEFKVDNMPLNLFIDTGSKISYIDKELSKNHKSIEVIEDFFLEYGKFKTNCYQIITYLQDEQFFVKYGNFPDDLYLFIDVPMIIGYDLFNNFLLLFDFKNKKLKFKKY